ncbi:hypothetical protein TQ38_018550 [Novosphingobium sp. P6W]|nr:hypothetical protein TQ38_018550 [Novosphingobium sp. P6W]
MALGLRPHATPPGVRHTGLLLLRPVADFCAAVDMVQHSSLPASRRDGVTATLEAQDDAQATFGLFSEANRIIALGWVRIDWTTNQLLDMTDDIEAPNRLTFRPEDWARAASCLRKLPSTP